MLEYFTFKKVKKHQEQKAAEKDKSENDKGKEKSAAPEIVKDGALLADAASGVVATSPSPSPSPQIISPDAADEDGDDVSIDGTPVLDHEDEKFLERLTASSTSPIQTGADDDETPPPLPPRVKTPVIDIDSDDASSTSSKDGTSKKSKGKGKHEPSSPSTDDHKPKRFSFVTNLSRNITLRRKPAADLRPDHLAVPSGSEVSKEQTDLARVLDDLDLSARNNRAFSLSSESADMARRFTQVLRDLVSGVPTAYGDLVGLLEDRDGVLARTYEKLPSGLKKLVAQLPEKLTSSLAPELLAAAAEAQGLKTPDDGKGQAGLKDAAKKFLTPTNLHDLVTKPGALVGLLRGIVNALKTRFPAFVGTNVLWSLAVFLLLSMLWYCYKRGREVRLEREASEASAAAAAAAEPKSGDDEIGGRPRVEELPDDPMLTAPASGAAPAAPAATDAAREVANAKE